MDDAEVALVTLGSMTGAAKDAVDEARASAASASAWSRSRPTAPSRCRPSPRRCDGLKAVGVVDRSVSFGWNCGPLYQDVIGALQFGRQRPAAMSFIGGLAGADITTDHFGRAIERVRALAQDGQVGETVWLNEKD
jgi:phenylglyoxylate dehydrogenase alpha subunit